MKVIKIALIGYGYWGPNVAKNLYKNKEYEFVAICDKKVDRLEKANKVYANAVKYIENHREIMDNPEIDAVALAVETSAHYTLAKEALLAGKHVYVEKPFTDNVKDAEELLALAEERNLKIHVDHIMVYHPVIRKIKEIINSGELGDLLYFDCSRINLGNIKNDVSSMWDLSVHDLSIIDYLSDGAEPVSVKAMGKKVYSKKESITFMTLNYENFLANITSSWLSPIKERRLIIAGTKKMLVYDDVDVLNKLIVYDKGFDVESLNELEYDEFVVKTRIGDAVIPQLQQGDALFNSLEHFRQCIINDVQSQTDAKSAIRMLKILEAADKELQA
ncbi:Gfo/Idh/MocA family protein [Faecalicatena contorta]|uniref:Gfo/Idh/MocA family protein n=1 Tax=Faecalicatena contorta TaxID=39482 RepID=UPI001F301B72|nr:Gfo/Idh/MocA family oxidoreductase [Faecalicatena contorta]